MYDTCILGQISKDINVDCDGTTIYENGGAVIYSGFAAGSIGHKVAVVPKGNSKDVDPRKAFADADNVEVYPVESPECTSIKNVYHTPDKEQRTSTVVSRIESYKCAELPKLETRIYHIAGLMRGDLGDEIIDYCAAQGKAKVALDVQGVLRCVENGSMVYHDWADKLKYLPKIDFLKTDAKEAEILCNTTDRDKAAKMLYDWGAKEVVITHNTEVIAYDGKKVYRQPLKARSLVGRSGRGDTTFSIYITERLEHSLEEALLFAAAGVSCKMEKAGPFKGGRAAIEDYIKQFY